MKINVFEGARRITRLVAIVWFAFFVFNLFTTTALVLPIFEITMQDGTKYEVTAPEGATKEEALNYFKTNWQGRKVEVEVQKNNYPTIERIWTIQWENIKQPLLYAVAGVAIIYILSWSIGWIVRGFAGIPSGKDSKA